MNQPLWSPSREAIEKSRLTEFSQQVGYGEHSYDDLHRWSIERPGEFWQAAWDYFGVTSSVPASEPVRNLDQFPGASWFPDSRLNYAENLLRESSDKVAFISHLENGERREKTYSALHT